MVALLLDFESFQVGSHIPASLPAPPTLCGDHSKMPLAQASCSSPEDIRNLLLHEYDSLHYAPLASTTPLLLCPKRASNTMPAPQASSTSLNSSYPRPGSLQMAVAVQNAKFSCQCASGKRRAQTRLDTFVPASRFASFKTYHGILLRRLMTHCLEIVEYDVQRIRTYI